MCNEYLVSMSSPRKSLPDSLPVCVRPPTGRNYSYFTKLASGMLKSELKVDKLEFDAQKYNRS